MFIVTVPTPIDDYKRPDLTPLKRASETVGSVHEARRRGRVRVDRLSRAARKRSAFRSSSAVSGLKFNRDFFAGYSPERINPGDKQHRLTTIRKVTSGSTPEVADFVDRLYGSIVTAGTHQAS